MKSLPADRHNEPEGTGVPGRSDRARRDRVGAHVHAGRSSPAGVRTRRPAISPTTSPIKPASWSYAEGHVVEDDVLASARTRAEEVGVVPIGTGGGAALRFLASVLEARAVVEIGTGTGVSGIWLLRGMRPDGVLTTVDIEAEHQRLAKQSFAEAGIPPQRARTISGAALDVLPRLTDGHYDLVFCDGDKSEYTAYLKEALRLLRPGGVVVFDNALWHDRVADPAHRDEETVTIRELGKEIADDDSLTSVLLPVGDGLLAAKKEWSPEAG
ncbi:MAG: O-methyltransferase [Nocardioides sp.]